ncbi:MAG: TolC family outer membrane protein [Pseudomonadota bacterium]
MSLASGSASAIGLLAAYEAALANDPTYRAAYFENEAGKENRLIGRAGLLPNISTSYSATKNRSDLETTSQTALGAQTSLTHPQYISRSAMINLRQPIINFDATARYREGVAQSKVAAVQFTGRTQDLALRLVGAYLDALFASEQLTLVTAQRDTYREQASVNARLFEKGEGSRTDMIETQARLDLAEAQLIESQDNRKIAYDTLTTMIGQEPGELAPLNAEFKVPPFSLGSFEEWKKTALANSAEIQTLILQVEIAREQINKGRAGHMPRLDFVANYGKQNADTIATANQESTVRAIGIQLQMPLYAGGQVGAVTRQAAASLERARFNLQASIDKAVIEVKKQHALVQSSTAKVEALEKAVASSKLLVKATEQSIKGGVRINLDLLNAQQQMYTSQRDLAQARYNYLLNGLRLRFAAGTLVFDDVRQVASYFR